MTARSFRSEGRYRDPGVKVPARETSQWTATTPRTGVPIVVTPPPAPTPIAPPAPTVTPGPARSGWRPFRRDGDTDREQRITRPVVGCRRVALLSPAGGVGKTTLTASLGATFASLRDDRVVAVDAAPERGTLAEKVPPGSSATVRHLLRDIEGIDGYDDVRGYTSRAPSGLEVLASESDPTRSEAFGAEDYRRTLEVLRRCYALVLTDCGTGLRHPTMAAVLGHADALVIVGADTADGARGTAAALDWLDAHGHRALVARSVAVVNAVRPGRRTSGEPAPGRCRASVTVPFDAHLAAGGVVDLPRLRRRTRAALADLAAAVADGFDA